MKHKHQLPTASYAQTYAASGANFGALPPMRALIPWQPSTWPPAPVTVDAGFIASLGQIFKESILNEIGNVIQDAKKCNGDLQRRGHVVGISMMCALDAISSHGYRNAHIAHFIANHFPQDYKPHANDFCSLYRNSLVHSWNLFEAAILPGKETIQKNRGTLCFGLLNFFEALQEAVKDFLQKLATDTKLQTNTLNRYKKLKQSARP